MTQVNVTSTSGRTSGGQTANSEVAQGGEAVGSPSIARKRGGPPPIFTREEWLFRKRARARFGSAVRDGRIQRQFVCERCGYRHKRGAHMSSARAVTPHHADYTKPFDVEWLCHFCHRDADKLARAAFFAIRGQAALDAQFERVPHVLLPVVGEVR
jgi:hypothetical protein